MDSLFWLVMVIFFVLVVRPQAEAWWFRRKHRGRGVDLRGDVLRPRSGGLGGRLEE